MVRPPLYIYFTITVDQTQAQSNGNSPAQVQYILRMSARGSTIVGSVRRGQTQGLRRKNFS